jgi:hypothetical protein
MFRRKPAQPIKPLFVGKVRAVVRVTDDANQNRITVWDRLFDMVLRDHSRGARLSMLILARPIKRIVRF